MIHVMIVEDDPMVSSIHRSFIEKDTRCHVVGEYPNGRAALEHLEESGADLILLDLFMPVCSGPDFLRELRTRGMGADVIVISAATDPGILTEVLRLGVVDYVLKPYSTERLEQAMRKYFRYRSALDSRGAVDQQVLDSLLCLPGHTASHQPLKGVQHQTLENIRGHLDANSGRLSSSGEIARHVGLSQVTVRRYMNYMIDTGEVLSVTDYSTGGRPRTVYRLR